MGNHALDAIQTLAQVIPTMDLGVRTVKKAEHPRIDSFGVGED